MKKDLESESDHKGETNRRATAGSRRGSAGANRRGRANLYNLVDFYIVDTVNYIGLYIQLVMYDIDVQFCTFLRLCDFVGFCGILACFVVRRIT